MAEENTTTEQINNTHFNPLDAAETFIEAQKWEFDRLADDQLYLGIEGERGNYKLFLMWDETQNALQLCCEIDLCMPKTRLTEIHKMLANINSQMWLGHFDLSKDNTSECIAPCFRYTSLIREMEYMNCVHFIKDLMKVTLQECERLHDAFHVLDKTNDVSLMNSTINSTETMKLALAQAEGHC